MDWSEVELKEHHFEILPLLLTAVNTRNHANKALNIVFSSIVRMVRVDCLEEVIFSEFCHLSAGYYFDTIVSAEKLVANIREDDDDDDDDVKEQVGSLIETCLEVLQSMWSCVDYLSTVVGELRISGIKSLASGTLTIIEETYKHCQDSSSKYGRLFNIMSMFLSEMFKKSFALHSNLLRLLEEMIGGIEEEERNELEILAYVADKSALLCDLVSNIDRNATIGPWKFIFRIFTSLNLEDAIDSGIIIRILMKQIMGVLNEIQNMETPQEDTPEEVQRSREEHKRLCKFVEFLFRILGLLVEKNASSVDGCMEETVEFISRVKEMTIMEIQDSKFGDPSLTQDLRSSVSVATESMIGLLADNHGFLMMISTGDGCSDGIDGMRETFRKLLVLLVVMRCAQSINIARWSCSTSNDIEMLTDCTLVRIAFERIKRCEALMLETLSVSHCAESIRPYKTLSLYEEVLRSIGTFISKLHEKHFLEIEEILLDNLLPAHFYNSMMSCDIWCCLARMSPEMVRWQHFSLLVGLFEKFKVVRGVNGKRKDGCDDAMDGRNVGRVREVLMMIIRRIFQLLPTNQQVASFETYPIMWIITTPPKCSEMKSITNQKVRDCVGGLDRSLDALSKNRTLKDLHLLLELLTSFASITEHLYVLDLNTLLNLMASLEKIIQIMMCSIRSDFKVRNKVIAKTLVIFGGILSLSAGQPFLIQPCYDWLIRLFQLVTKVMADKKYFISCKVQGNLCLAICPFIESLSNIKFTHKDKGLVRDVLQSLAELTNLCTTIGQSFARERLLQIFSDFLRHTPNPEVPLLIGRSKVGGGLMVSEFVQKMISGRSERNGCTKDSLMMILNYVNVVGGDDSDDDDAKDDNNGDHKIEKEDDSKADNKPSVDDILSTIETCLASLETTPVLDDKQRSRLEAIKMSMERLS